MEPHSGVGGCTPSPRKLRPAAPIITMPMLIVENTMTGEMALGKICLKIIFALLQLMAVDASKYSCVRSPMMAARNRRTGPAIPPMPIAKMVLNRPLPSAVEIQIVIKVIGMA